MNIFFLDRDPEAAAQLLHDKHVVKMCLETAQIMCTVQSLRGVQVPYKPTHAGHPCVIWAGASALHFEWLRLHGLALCKEYTFRYSKIHKCEDIIRNIDNVLPADGWIDPPQCMPDEFKVPGDVVAGYQNYYLARKVGQSNWTLRDVPSFVDNRSSIMAKKPTKSAQAPEQADQTPTPEKSDPTPAPRGLKGVPESAVITLKVATNPKRPNSKSFDRFAAYKDGMSCKEALDAGVLTADLAWDAKHGFIEIDGYAVPGGVLPPKAPKAPKEPKGKGKGKKEVVQPTEEELAARGAADSEAQSETME